MRLLIQNNQGGCIVQAYEVTHYYSKTAYTATVTTYDYVSLFSQVHEYYPYGKYSYLPENNLHAANHEQLILSLPPSQLNLKSSIFELVKMFSWYWPFIATILALALMILNSSEWLNWQLYFSALIAYIFYKLSSKHKPENNYIIFNRRTGIISILTNNPTPQEQKLYFKDCRAAYYYCTGAYNLIPHQLILLNKSSNYFGTIAKFNYKKDVELYWKMLQQYMNINSPLPDLPNFEENRLLDPVTAIFDQTIQREEYYWRNMSAKELIQLIAQSCETSKA